MSPSLARRVRRTGGRLIRRLGLLPDGDPDGLGDDDALRGQSLPFAVLVYFPDTARNLYQLRQWYEPLLALDAQHRVGIVCLDSRTAARPAGVPTAGGLRRTDPAPWRTSCPAATWRSRCT